MWYPVATPGSENIEAALAGMDIILVTAGMPRRPGMSREELFDINAAVVKRVAEAAAKVGAPYLCLLRAPL